MNDLKHVSTHELVTEAQRRAPVCLACHLTMLVTPTWYRCPACGMTEDFK